MLTSQQNQSALLYVTPKNPESDVPSSKLGEGAPLSVDMVWRYNFVIFQYLLTFSQMDSMVIFTYSLTYFFITLCLSLGITRTRISPIFEIFATYCSKIVINKSTNPSLKNIDGQIYYTIFIYYNIAEYILDSHSKHNKGGD